MDEIAAKRITLVYFDAGGGHRAAARALQQAIAQQQRPWSVSLVNLFEAMDPNGRFQRLLGCKPEDYYNLRLQRGWTLGLGQELRLLQLLIRVFHRPMVRALQQHWRATQPQLVLSLIPNFNRTLYESLALALPGVPFATLLTDIADTPPHFWIEPGQRQQLIVGSERAHEQALSAGYAQAQVSRVSGMLLHPGFYVPAPSAAQRAQTLRDWGLDPGKPTGIVMFGGQGSMQMLRISRALPDRQLILLCGRNEALRERLMRSDAELPRRHIALGYTEQVAQVLRLGDYFIGKPGPGALSEALHCGLPAITFDGLGLMPQERYNTQWLREQGLGVVLRSVGQVREGVDDLLADLPVYRERVARLHNRAVHEVPAILDTLLQAGAETARALRRTLRDDSRQSPAAATRAATPSSSSLPLANSYRVKP